MSQLQDAGDTPEAPTLAMAERVERLNAAIVPPSPNERAFSNFTRLDTARIESEPDNRPGGARPRP